MFELIDFFLLFCTLFLDFRHIVCAIVYIQRVCAKVWIIIRIETTSSVVTETVLLRIMKIVMNNYIIIYVCCG